MQLTSPHDDFFEHGQPVRYMSPGATQASTLSEASYSGDSANSIDMQNHPIRYSTSPANILPQHAFKLHDSLDAQNMPWQPQAQCSKPQRNVQTIAPSVLPSQRSMPVKGGELEHEDDKDMDFVFEEDLVTLSARTPLQMPQPEEVDFSEPTTGSITSSGSTCQAKKSMDQYQSEDGLDEEEEDSVPQDNDSDSDYQMRPQKSKSTRNMPVKNPRSPPHKRKSSTNSTQGSYRVQKRSNSSTTASTAHSRRPSKSKSRRKGPIFSTSLSSSTTQPISKADRTFPCTFHHFGCPAEFPNKNEWKRHVACQHLQLGYYRCDLDGCNPDNLPPSASNSRRQSSQTANKTSKSETPDQEGTEKEIVVIYNDFNRKDLFTQHCRRMHGPSRNSALCSSTNKKGTCVATKEDEASFERQLDSIRRRCWSIRRKAPARSSCGFCDQVFDASYYTTTANSPAAMNGEVEQGPEEKAWEERMEHVGRHYEKDARARKETEELDEDLVKWGLETGVFYMLTDSRPWLVSAEVPRDEDGYGKVTAEDDEKAKKARRQPSRTVVVRKRSPVKEEPGSDVDADGEDE